MSLSACSEAVDDNIYLPDLRGKVEEDIVEIMSDKAIDYEIVVRINTITAQSREFIEYGRGLEIGDIYDGTSRVIIAVSALRYEDREYFEFQDISYDGPRLDPKFFEYEWFVFNEATERYRGGGGAFHVEYDLSQNIGRCIDGDTTVFEYPPAIRSRILSSTPSTRYLNIDTPETFAGGEEEWGKQATNYVCEMLDLAESFVLQTDPGDNLTGDFGRLLAWVWIRLPDAEEYYLLNYMVVRQGLAEVAFLRGAGSTDITVYEGLTYTEWMLLGEARAKEDGFAMHGEYLDYYWDYVGNRPFPGRW